MKKLIYCAAALAAMIFAGSCQQENLEPVAQENTVTYTVELPGVETKAIADGSNVNRLYYEVWKIDAENATEVTTDLTKDGVATRLYQNDIAMTSENGGPAKTVVTLNLVQDQEYTILFWAQNNNALGNGPAYNTANLTAVTYVDAILNGKKTPANNESLAAFYAVDFVLEGDPKSKTIYLKRPFAQLNIGTLNTVDANEYAIAMQKSQVTVSSVPTVFNVATSVASAPVEKFEFTSAWVPNNPEHPEYATNSMLQANGVTYQYAAMNYIFANYANAEGQSPATVEVDFNIDVMLSATDDATPTTTPATINHKVPNVPLSQNYRTNIVGNLLTSETEYNVIVDPNWADGNAPDGGYVVEKWNGTELQVPQQNANGEYEIEMASELAWLAAAVNGTLPQTKASVAGDSFNGKTFVLTVDIDLDNQEWTPIGLKNGKAFEGTFNGNGKTIKNLNVKTEGAEYAALFGYAKNATIKGIEVENATIISNYKAGVIVGEGNCTKISDCHVKNVTITSTPDKNNDNGNQAGGIVGHLVGEGGKAEASGCSVENATITAYRDVAGIAGTALESSTVTGNTVKNVTVVANQAQNYKEVKAPNAGAVTGRIDAKATIEPNTVENVEVYVLVDNATRLQNVLLDKNVKKGTTEIRFNADIKGNVTVDQQEGKNIVINGNGKKYDGTITIDGNSRNDGAETLVIKDVIFETTDPDVYFVEMNSKDGADRYAHNVTITNCTFKGNETSVGARFRQCYNIAFVECTMTSGHSLAQLYGCTGVTFDNVNVKAVSGISVGTSVNCKIEDSSFEVEEYGIRADGDGERTLNVTSTSVKAGIPLIVRYLTADYKVNLVDETFETTGDYHVVMTAVKDDLAYVRPTANYELNGADSDYLVFPDVTVVKSREELQAALDNTIAGDNLILLGAKIEGNVTVDQQEGKNIVIDGRDNEYDGTITIDGNSRSEGAETLVIKNVSFKAADEKTIEFIQQNSAESDVRYAHNVTIEGCTFEGGENAVATKFRQCYDIVIKDCEVIKGHSLAQLYGCTGVTVEGTTVTAARGISFGTSTNVVVKDSHFEVESYGLRADNVTATMALENVNIEATLPVVVRKLTTEHYTINFTGDNTLKTAGYQVVFTNGADDDTFVTPTGKYTLRGADDFLVFPNTDGKTRVYNADDLNTALADVNASKDIVLLPGTYKSTFAIQHNGTTITGTEGAVVNCINLNGKDNVTLKNITFDAAGATYGYDAAGTKKVYAFSNIITGDNVNKPIKGAHNLVIDGCKFTGEFANPGAPIAFTDDERNSGYSGNITIKNCVFENTNANYTIYAHYTGDSLNGHGNFVIENNTFNSACYAGPIYLGRYASNVPVVVTGNTFNTVTAIDYAIYVQDHSNYGVSIDASNNTFAN